MRPRRDASAVNQCPPPEGGRSHTAVSHMYSDSCKAACAQPESDVGVDAISISSTYRTHMLDIINKYKYIHLCSILHYIINK